jgi:hypothetical protein
MGWPLWRGGGGGDGGVYALGDWWCDIQRDGGVGVSREWVVLEGGDIYECND